MHRRFMTICSLATTEKLVDAPFPLLAPGINFRFSTVIPTAHHGNRRHRPHLPLSVRGCAVERSSTLVVLIDALDAVRPEGDAIE